MNNYRVLLVAPSDDYRHNIAELLQDDGLAVIHACDAYTGLRSINMYRPHAVICDTALGNSSAIDLMKMTKQTGNVAMSGIPFIFLYSDLDKETMLQAKAQGVEKFIDKLNPWPATQEAVWSVLTPKVH